MRSSLLLLPLALLPAFGALSSAAQDISRSPNTRSVQATQLGEHSITLDGALDEAVWAQAERTTNFTQQEPVEGGRASRRTEIRVLYSETHLYLGVTLHHKEGDRISVNRRQRDASLASDDRLMWILDPQNEGQNAYFFETNPAGLRGDGLLTTGQGTSLNKSWDGIWSVEVTRQKHRLEVEVRIPFRTLQFDPAQTNWGFNMQRTIRARNEELLWTGYKRNQGLFRPRFAGELRGLSGLSKGLGLEVTPYGLSRVTQSDNAGGAGTDVTGKIGGEVGLSITPTLRSALSINTDFAEVEVDRRRVNLTRFPLFFPEKRDFFLEASNTFEFAPRSAQFPFFSRRIGLVNGETVPILAGVRLNGRAGPYEVGLFQVRTRETENIPADTLTLPTEDFTAARAIRNLGAQSQIGVVYTRRATHAEAGTFFDRFQNRHTLGVDLELGTSRLFGDKTAQFQAFFVGHNAPLRADTTSFGHRTTRGVRFNYPNAPWSAHVSYREFGESYDPAVGFVQRRGFRRLQPSVGYNPFLEAHPWIRSLEFGTRFEYLTDLALEPQTVQVGVQPFGLTLESGDSFELSVGRLFERLNAPFDILGNGRIILPPDSYTTYTGRASLRTADFRLFSGTVTASHGGFWSGTRTQLETGLTTRPLTGLSLSANWSLTDASLDQGSFTTHVVRFNSTYSPTPDLSFSTRIQFDNLSDRLGLFTRIRWITKPGSDLFLVLTRNWRRTDGRFSPVNSEIASKITYSVRF